MLLLLQTNSRSQQLDRNQNFKSQLFKLVNCLLLQTFGTQKELIFQLSQNVATNRHQFTHFFLLIVFEQATSLKSVSKQFHILVS